MSKVVHLTDSNFDEEVVQADTPVLVDFWAPWCGPCRMLTPTIEDLAEEYEGRIKVAKLNTQESNQVPISLGIRSIPAVLLFDGSDVVDALIGARPKDAFTSMIDKYLKKWNKKQKKAAWKKESATASETVQAAP